MRRRLTRMFFSIILLLCIPKYIYGVDSKGTFKKITEKEELKDFIRIHQRAVIQAPNLEDTKNCRFGVGEYYFKHNNIYDARTTFKEYTNVYPPQISTFIAKIFLYKIAELHGDTAYGEKIKKEIFEKPFIILFSDHETLEYASVLGNKYVVHNYLDRVEVFLNGQLFEEIKP